MGATINRAAMAATVVEEKAAMEGKKGRSGIAAASAHKDDAARAKGAGVGPRGPGEGRGFGPVDPN